MSEIGTLGRAGTSAQCPLLGSISDDNVLALSLTGFDPKRKRGNPSFHHGAPDQLDLLAGQEDDRAYYGVSSPALRFSGGSIAPRFYGL
jgi:hypothetical protein